MSFLRETFAGNTVWAWFVALGIFAATLAFLRLVRWIACRVFTAQAARTKTDVFRVAAQLARHTRLPFFLALALQGAALSLTLSPTASRAVNIVTIVFVSLQVGTWGSYLIAHWVAREEERKRAEKDAAAVTTLNVMAFLAKIVLWAILLLLVLQNLGVNITALITGLGIAGIAVALALQNIFGDLFASLAIVLDKPFMVGDFIEVGTFMGTVERIGLKTTRIRSLSGEELVFANSDLLRQPIRDYKRMRERRVAFTFAVSFQTPYEKLAAIPKMVRDIVEAHSHARFDRAHLKEYGDSGPRFEVVYHVLSPDYRLYMDVQEALNLALVKRFQEEGIAFAYPTRTIYMRAEGQAKEDKDGRQPCGRSGLGGPS